MVHFNHLQCSDELRSALSMLDLTPLESKTHAGGVPQSCACCGDVWDGNGSKWTQLRCGHSCHAECIYRTSLEGAAQCPKCFAPLLGGGSNSSMWLPKKYGKRRSGKYVHVGRAVKLYHEWSYNVSLHPTRYDPRVVIARDTHTDELWYVATCKETVGDGLYDYFADMVERV